MGKNKGGKGGNQRGGSQNAAVNLSDYFGTRDRFEKKLPGLQKLFDPSNCEIHVVRPSFNRPVQNERHAVYSNHFQVTLPKEQLYQYHVVGMDPPPPEKKDQSKEEEPPNDGSDSEQQGASKEEESPAAGSNSEQQGASTEDKSPKEESDSEQQVASEEPEEESLSRRAKRLLLDSFIKKSPVLTAEKANFATDDMSVIVAWKDLSAIYQKDSAEETILEEHDVKLGSSSKAHTYKLQLKFIGEVDTKSFQKICAGDVSKLPYELSTKNTVPHALNIIISHATRNNKDQRAENFSVGGKKCYQVNTRKPSHGLEIYSGFFSTIKTSMGTPLLNVNRTTGLFLPGNKRVDTFAAEYKAGWQKALIGTRVAVLYQKVKKAEEIARLHPSNQNLFKERTIKGFGLIPSKQTFTMIDADKNETVTSVRKYLKDRYEIDFTDNLPCVDLGSGKKDDHAWFPADKLEILPYQPFRLAAPPDVTSDMIAHARKSPAESCIEILDSKLTFLGLQNRSDGTSPVPADFAIKPDMVAIPVKVMNAPKVTYVDAKGQESKAAVEVGAWNLSNQNLLSPGRLRGDVWVVHSSPVDAGQAQNWGKALFTEMKIYKIKVPADTRIRTIELPDLKRSNFDDAFKQIPQGSLVIYLNPDNKAQHASKFAYSKQCGDQTYGLQTICLTADKMTKLDSGESKAKFKDYMANAILKINLKLGGYNHKVELIGFNANGQNKNWMKERNKLETMILGADVTHTGPKATPKTPSLASVVGSVEGDFGTYGGSMRAQRANSELIADFKGMVIERLQAWSKRNENRWPSQILYYRDGVDEGQYSQVRKEEVEKIKDAFAECIELDKKEREMKEGKEKKGKGKKGKEETPEPPKVTAVIVAKRHHTRFYPTQVMNKGTGGNCEPGTVIDVGVTDPVYFDFFLQSHDAIQGTAKPSHYFVLKNEIDLTAEQLQEFTYRLCYTYVRATRSVSYAPPAYYADRLCERGRSYCKDFLDGTYRKTSKQSTDHAWKEAWGPNKNPWHKNLDDTMFWM
ncbi:Piwi-domain-containing protein [Lophium mytilinum]|uniref:Piwi-domain-containing protein n=1 Tax=Lophium mytilinum TaxID=390894 RepID=A0A6A6RBP6_9PEZI|nr:Piwi-domain-containing protein [Lophium mytilinum]